MSHEMWDIVDKDGNVVGQMERGSCRVPEGYYHQAVEVIPTDGKGHVLLTKRSLEKRSDPGAYEFVAGSVISGETPSAAALRELREETGLSPYKLQRLGTSRIPGLIRYAFLAFVEDLPNAKVTLQAEETIGYQVTTFDGWLECMNEGLYAQSRSATYNDAFLAAVRKAVGEAEEPPAPQTPKKPGVVKAVSGLAGFMGGGSKL